MLVTAARDRPSVAQACSEAPAHALVALGQGFYEYVDGVGASRSQAAQ